MHEEKHAFYIQIWALVMSVYRVLKFLSDVRDLKMDVKTLKMIRALPFHKQMTTFKMALALFEKIII